jgi:hypothetical protein
MKNKYFDVFTELLKTDRSGSNANEGLSRTPVLINSLLSLSLSMALQPFGP